MSYEFVVNHLWHSLELQWNNISRCYHSALQLSSKQQTFYRIVCIPVLCLLIDFMVLVILSHDWLVPTKQLTCSYIHFVQKTILSCINQPVYLNHCT